MSPVIIIATLAGFVLLMIFISLVTWYRKCPSDRIMIIYGKTGGNQAAKCIHGGAKFVWPVVQDYGYISLRPLQIAVNLDNALCKQNIRINVPSVFTVGVSTSPEIMGNAAERLFGQSPGGDRRAGEGYHLRPAAPCHRLDDDRRDQRRPRNLPARGRGERGGGTQEDRP